MVANIVRRKILDTSIQHRNLADYGDYEPFVSVITSKFSSVICHVETFNCKPDNCSLLTSASSYSKVFWNMNVIQ